MGFLKRLFGDGGPTRAAEPADPGDPAAPDDGGIAADEDEIARDRELLRAEAERLQDELLQRQLRYADRSWTPPAQGGARRAGDEASADER